MSTMASDTVFLSALQPNTSVTTYGLPSDVQLGNGGSVSNETAKARRVQQQIQMRLAEKSTLPRQNGSVSQYAMSEHGGSTTRKYQTFNPNFSSKSSYMYAGSRTMGPRVPHRSGFSSQSAAPDMLQFQRMSVGNSGAGGGISVGGGGGGGIYREDIRMGNYQGNIRPQSQMDPETLSVHSMRQSMRMNPWMNDDSDGGSLVSDRDATFTRNYAQNTMNGYTSQVKQGAGTMTFPPPTQRSLSGTLYRGGGMAGGEAEIVQQHSFKGPAHRTISRITNRNRMSMGSTSGTLQHQMSSGGSIYGGGDRVDSGFITSAMSGSQGNLYSPHQSSLSRAMSIKSMHSVGRGMDIFSGQMDSGASIVNGISTLDVGTAVQYLSDPDPEMQVLGAAYIQHECYSNNEAKREVRQLRGISGLVGLINSDNTDVQRYATGATRNLIYENMENKVSLIDEGGIPKLLEALKTQDEEVNKNVTGILWNLSSKDTLKEKLAKEVLPDLTDKVLVPLSVSPDSNATLTASEADILYNTTGCLRNLSSVNEKTRRIMRGTKGLVESLVSYIRGSIENNKLEDKGVENTMCVLRNLSYQLYSELSPSTMVRLEGPTRETTSGKGEAIGCFTPQSRKAKNTKNQDLTTFAEVARVPKGEEWLWHPDIVEMYKGVLYQCEINSTTREAAAGALQNITAGDKRWAGVLSRVALEQQRILPVLLDRLNNSNDSELRSVTGLLRNLSRHAKDKNDMATKVVSHLVAKLPEEKEKGLSNDVLINICGVLNNLVTSTPIAAREITYFDGLPKLLGIKNSGDSSPLGTKASTAAATVLSNMFLYKKLHKQYSMKGFTKQDFVNLSKEN